MNDMDDLARSIADQAVAELAPRVDALETRVAALELELKNAGDQDAYLRLNEALNRHLLHAGDDLAAIDKIIAFLDQEATP